MPQISNEQFVHLHLHTEFSLLDGACRIDKLMQKVKSLGQTAVAITDHGVMYGTVDFFKAAQKHGVKPIIGCEVYVAPRTRFDKVNRIDTSPYHLVLLCKNETGYRNLIKMVSLGFTEGFYSKPRVDRELLEKHSEGIIALSACLAGEIPQALLAGDYEKATQTALYYKHLFGEGNYYIELQNHGIDEQIRILPDLIRIARENNIPLVATNDCHYIEHEDAMMQKVLICIQTNRTVNDDNAMEFKTQNFYVRSTEEMAELFAIAPDSITNTAEIAERCNFEFEFGNTKLPYFEVPGNIPHDIHLRKLCDEGLAKRYPEITPELSERLEYELGVINKMGFTDYFLIVQDYVNYAKTHDIPVGPGRGSGAGSLVAYCIGITNIDPIKYNLLFERFLNPDRVSMPDFDVDFCYEKRLKVLDYVIERYGADHVAQIITFGTMAARLAIRDVGRAMDIPYGQVDRIAKLVPKDLGITLTRALEISKDFKSLYDESPDVKRLVDMAIKVEGMPRHASTHAAAVVITPKPVSDLVPLQKNDEQVVTQFPMSNIEQLGLLKMDFLGLRTLTVIDDAVKLIHRREPDFDIDTIPNDDPETFEMLSAGKSEGVFQFESSGMKELLVKMKASSIEDLTAAVSLYRPGPMDSIPQYITNRSNPEHIKYKHQMLERILNVTNGCIIYQEQVMQIFRELGNYTLGQADIVRRAMAKKKHDVMKTEGEKFVEGCKKNGIPEKVASEIYDDMASFASYAFNKSHAAAYAVLSFQTAYLRCHYKTEFLAALLTSELDNTDKITEYIALAQSIDISVLPPDINSSEGEFTVEGQAIRVGLSAVKNAGRSFIANIVKERTLNGKYASFLDFCRRISKYDSNRRAIENLISCGAFDEFSLNRRTMLSGLELVLKSIQEDDKRNLDGQLDLFSSSSEQSTAEASLPIVPEFPQSEILRLEKETTGLYLSGHPLFAYRSQINANATCFIKDLQDENNQRFDNQNVNLFCLINTVRKRVTKNNDTMAICTVEDLTGSLEMMVFSKKLEQFGREINENSVVIINARVSLKEDESAKLILNNIQSVEAPSEQTAPLEQQPAPPPKKDKKLYIKLPSRESAQFEQVRALLELFDGSEQVNLFFEDRKQLVRYTAGCEICTSLLNAIRDAAGEENVVEK